MIAIPVTPPTAYIQVQPGCGNVTINRNYNGNVGVDRYSSRCGVSTVRNNHNGNLGTTVINSSGMPPVIGIFQ